LSAERGYPILLTAATITAATAAVTALSAASIAAVVYGAVAVSLTFDSIWIHVGNVQRGTFELLVMLALVSLNFHSLARTVRGALMAFWTFTAAYVFYGAFDAAFIREALLSNQIPALRH
jgi:hypothetical protein